MTRDGRGRGEREDGGAKRLRDEKTEGGARESQPTTKNTSAVDSKFSGPSPSNLLSRFKLSSSDPPPSLD